MPNISDDLIPHFIRGYFDGDGCFSYSICHKNSIQVQVNFVAKTKTLLYNIKTYLENYNITALLYYKKDKDLYTLEIRNQNHIKKFYELLYNNSNFYMKRKYEKFNHFVNTEVTQLIAEYRKAQELKASNTNNTPTSVEHPTGMNMCAELTGNCENSGIKSSEDNIIEDSQKF